MNLFYTNIIIFLTCFLAIASRRQDYDDEPVTKLNSLYTTENEVSFRNSYIHLKGSVRRNFAVLAAIERHNKNMLCSPWLALVSLGQLAIGARGETLNELLSAIGIFKKKELFTHFAKLIKDFRNIHNITISMASKIYLPRHLKLYRKYQARLSNIFDTIPDNVDFDNSTIATAKINKWVSEVTNSSIKNLMSTDLITARTSLFLVNAIYFKGLWETSFNEPVSKQFSAVENNKPVKINVPWLTTTGDFRYYYSRILGAELIEMPYEGRMISMIMVLPEKNDGLPGLLSQLKLAPYQLDNELSKMGKRALKLRIPAFKMEVRFDLVDVFKKLGLQNIFNGDFSGLQRIVKTQALYLSNAVQKCVIEVNHTGTQAADARAAVLPLHQPVYVYVNADRPFMFYIISQKQQIFAGTVYRPPNF